MYTIKKLRQIGKERDIKYSSKMNSQTLCDKLNIPLVRNKTFDMYNKDKINKPVGILLVNQDTKEKTEFHSIYKAAKHLGVNPSCIPHYIKKVKVIMREGKLFTVIKKPQV